MRVCVCACVRVCVCACVRVCVCACVRVRARGCACGVVARYVSHHLLDFRDLGWVVHFEEESEALHVLLVILLVFW